MPGCSERIGVDMDAEQRDCSERRRELEALLSKAPRQCLKHRCVIRSAA
jgi:hypothetical protein